MSTFFVEMLYFLVFVAILIAILGSIFVYITSMPPNLHRAESEKYYVDPTKENKKFLFPSIDDRPTIDLSVIVPAYNEEERLPVMMNEAMEYFSERKKKQPRFTYEVIVVDDGSKDKTTETALMYTERYGTENVRVLTLGKNRGKGGAVRIGMLSSRGKLLLFADADGATRFSDIEKLEKEMNVQLSAGDHTGDKNGMVVVCGSRAHLEQDSIAQRSFLRTVLMYGFHFMVWFFCVRGVKDTQCGFKMFTREAGRLLFKVMHVDRWAFDVDILHIAEHYKIAVKEVAVNWQEIEGSKLSPLWASLQMGRDIVLIRLRYLLGAWSMNLNKKSQ